MLKIIKINQMNKDTLVKSILQDEYDLSYLSTTNNRHWNLLCSKSKVIELTRIYFTLNKKH